MGIQNIVPSDKQSRVETTKISGGKGHVYIRPDMKNRNQLWCSGGHSYILTQEQAINMANHIVDLVERMN